MHDDAASEVRGLEGSISVSDAREVPGSTPDRMRDRVVDENRPKEGEEHHRREFHPLGDGADDKGRRDRREHGLEEGEGGPGYPRLIGAGLGAEAGETKVLGATKDMSDQAAGVALTKDEAITETPPHQDTHRGQSQALGGDGEHILTTNPAAVEQEEAWDAHHQDERGTHEDPGVITGGRSRSGRNKHNAF